MTIPAQGIAHYYAHDRSWQKAHISCMDVSGGSDRIHYMLESFMDPKSKNDPTTNQQTRKEKDDTQPPKIEKGLQNDLINCNNHMHVWYPSTAELMLGDKLIQNILLSSSPSQ
jgi:hypothetical protein